MNSSFSQHGQRFSAAACTAPFFNVHATNPSEEFLIPAIFAPLTLDDVRPIDPPPIRIS
ncbi:MAG TPA: hypothetical protein VK514_03240 [Candidatus Acidoferrum sp.]|jgi:hypothetical protein|nr:hypothetical protein [Candidatus Acidoferrum sp.]